MRKDNNNSLKYLRARSLIAGDLFQEGKILRVECFRIEMDEFLGKNTGPIKYQDNMDYVNGDM